MKKKSLLDLVFMGTGSCILIVMIVITSMNFMSDARIIQHKENITSNNTASKNILPQSNNAMVDDKTDKIKLVKAKESPVPKAVQKSVYEPSATGKISIEVINYTGRSRLAEDIRTTLESAGYVVSAGNGKSFKPVSSAIIERNTKKAGDKVRKLINVGKIISQYDPNSRFDITVILGDDYKP